MARYPSDGNQVTYFFESGTYSNVSGTAQWIGLVTESNIQANENITQLRYVGQNTRDFGMHVNGVLDYEVSLTYHPQDWKMLLFALGSCYDAGSPSPYTHALLASNNTDTNAYVSGVLNPFISFTLENAQTTAGGNNFIRTAKGCNINTFELSATAGEIAEVSIKAIAQSCVPTSGAKSNVSASTLSPFLWSDFVLHMPSGTTFDTVTEFTLSINNNINAPHYINGSRVISTPIPENREYELSMTLNGTSEKTDTLYNTYYASGTEFNTMLQCTVVSAGAGSRDAFFIMSGCRLTNFEGDTQNEGTGEQSIKIVPKNMVVLINDTIQRYNPW